MQIKDNQLDASPWKAFWMSLFFMGLATGAFAIRRLPTTYLGFLRNEPWLYVIYGLGLVMLITAWYILLFVVNAFLDRPLIRIDCDQIVLFNPRREFIEISAVKNIINKLGLLVIEDYDGKKWGIDLRLVRQDKSERESFFRSIDKINGRSAFERHDSGELNG